jgi:hypothetical protein
MLRKDFNDYDISFDFNIDISDYLEDLVGSSCIKNKNGKEELAYYGEWETEGVNNKYALYFYEYDNLRKRLMFWKGHNDEEINYDINYKCLLKDIATDFKNYSYKVNYHNSYESLGSKLSEEEYDYN